MQAPATPLERPADRHAGPGPDFDLERFRLTFRRLGETVEPVGGLEACISGLRDKQAVMSGGLAETLATRSIDPVVRMLERVFTARRRLYPALAGAHADDVFAALAAIARGEGDPCRLVQRVVDLVAVPTGLDRESRQAAARVRRAAWDFGAEILHYADPVRYPLMARWVWDATTGTGALREFVRDHEMLLEVPIAADASGFASARSWLEDRLRELGLYRDLPLWVDLVLAQAYVGYVRAMTEGSLGADFGRGAPAHEQLRKFLGIDPPLPGGRRRVRGLADGLH